MFSHELHSRLVAYRTDNRQAWTRDLAAAAVRIHSVTPDRNDLSILPSAGQEQIRLNLNEYGEKVATSEDPIVRRIYTALRSQLDLIDWPLACLVHDDFWPGNTVWYRGRLVAVIDWEDAKLGDRRTDVAQAQLEFAFTIDLEAADMFVAAYEEMSAPLPHLWYLQLYRGLGALFSVEQWLEGYSDAGIMLEPFSVRRDLGMFVQRALDEANAFFSSARLAGP